ncbi:MAG TPA: DAHL domain-containing protein [Polyangiaceae bacterium]|nr:DAHL domain-containing protein [Polyangiaceae bacterium]
MSRIQKRWAGALLMGCGAAVAVALYFKTQPVSTQQRSRIVDGFAVLQTLDAKIAQETLAARYGIAASYDPLTGSARAFATAEAELARDLEDLAGEQAELAAALGALREQARTRAEAVEHFKTQNSVLKNSLYYLPLAAQQVSDALASEGTTSEPAGAAPQGAPSELRRAISELVQVTLTQNLIGGRAEAARVEDQLARVQALQPRVPAPALERFRLLIAHARTVLHTQQLVDPLLRDSVLGAGVNVKLGELERSYDRIFNQALSEASLYRTILYAWSTVLLVAVLVVAFQLRSLYARLENLVSERTRELDQALKELWGEMALAKKIQTALVPKKLELRDCEVAAVMRPTAQVGGDYYDVFTVDGTEWVLIGDVSGHGVPAGLVMMMCQTSVRSVLAACPKIGPDELLTIVNCTLTENIERLGEDKYMTISALRRDPDGSFQFAGMHQDLLVYRAATGGVEQLPAQGTWLGITGNIRGMNPVRTLRLTPGDALVLYTDGITEASRNGQMLDVRGLEQTMVAHGAGSAEAMLAGILHALEGYDVKDDVAAVVIKQQGPGSALKDAAA